MSVKMKPTSVIKTRLGIQKNGPAHSFFTLTCFRYMSPFVPGGVNSHLNQNVDLQVDKVIYQGPAPHYLYIGKKYIDPKYKKGAFYSADYGYWSRPGITKINSGQDLEYHTSGTGAYWDKRMMTSKGNEVVKEVQEYVNRGCK